MKVLEYLQDCLLDFNMVGINKLGIFKKNENLAKYSGFKCGGNAETFFIPNNQECLIEFLKKNTEKINIIGDGYNLLIRDGIIDGVTILTKNINQIDLLDNKIIVGCGTSNLKLFNFTKKNSIGGFEFLGCIPGTVGGACKMNAGCYGSEVKDILLGIRTVNLNGEMRYFSKEECDFSYRNNNLPEDLIFLEAIFDSSNYKSVDNIDITFKQMLEKKLKTQPTGEKTCGSTFKNPSGISAWKVIKDLGLSGYNYNGARFSEKHANFLINNNSNPKNIEELIKMAQEKAMSKFGIELELEIKIIGNNII